MMRYTKPRSLVVGAVVLAAMAGMPHAYSQVTAAPITGIDRPVIALATAVRGAAPAPTGVVYSESFDGADGSNWPAPWAQLNAAVTSATLEDDAGRLAGQTSQVARMGLASAPLTNAEVTFSISYEAFNSQGFGFYIRQNGGALKDTIPHGQGYAVFVEGSQQVVGLWREVDGVEKRITASPVGNLIDGVAYRVKFRVEQVGSATRLSAKVWPAAGVEPADWTVETTDATPILQNVVGGYAADTYNYAGVGGISIDNLVITAI